MKTLPLSQQVVSMSGYLDHQSPHVSAPDADAGYQFRRSIRPKQVDFRLSWTGDVDMCGLMIERVDHKPKPVGAMDNDHPAI